LGGEAELRLSLFEYLAAANTLILSFAVARVIGGLPDSLAPSRRYWVHLALILALFFTMATNFWNFWSFRAVEWTFARFLIVLILPSFLHFMAATIMPSSPDNVESWREFYFSIRRRYFGAWIVLAFLVALTFSIILDHPVLHPSRAGQVALLVLGVIGLSSDHPSVHAGIAIAALLMGAASVLVLFARPGSIAS